MQRKYIDQFRNVWFVHVRCFCFDYTFLVSEYRFGVSPVNYPDPDPDSVSVNCFVDELSCSRYWYPASLHGACIEPKSETKPIQYLSCLPKQARQKKKALDICVCFDKISVVSSQTRETFELTSDRMLVFTCCSTTGEKRRLNIHWPLILLAKFWYARYLTNEILWNVKQKWNYIRLRREK